MLVVAVGLLVAFSQFAIRVEAGQIEEAGRRLFAPFSDMIVFPILLSLAFRYRRRPEVHKRLMVLTSTMLLVAAVVRMSFLGEPPQPLVFIAVWLSPVWVAMLHDAVFRRTLHPVYAIGFVALSILSLRMPLVDTAAWRATSQWLAGLFV